MGQEQTPEETDEQLEPPESAEPKASGVDPNHVRGLMYALITICVFCASILLGPDEQILPADGDLKIPIVNLTIKQGSFLYFGPIIIICVSMYTYFFLLKILAKISKGREYSDKYIFTMRNPAAQVATYAIFFWLPTLVLFAFAYKGLPRPESAHLLGVALIFLIFVISVQVVLRLRPFKFLGVVSVSSVCVALVLLGFVGDEGYLESIHKELRTLRPMALDKVDLDARDLREVDISNAAAEAITLRGAFLRDIVIKDSSLVGARLERADMRNATMECTILREANFDNADLENAQVLTANLEGTKFRGAILKNANFRTAPKSCCEGLNPSSDTGKKCLRELGETNLVHANLEKADLSGASFIGVFFRKTKFNGANLAKAKIIGSSVMASSFGEKFNQKTDLTRADLQCSAFNGSDMEGVILRRAELGGTSLSYANLANADLFGAQFYPLDCSDSCINLYAENQECSGDDKRAAQLVKSNLAFANLKQARLEEVDLEEADLRGADLRDASISGVILENTNLLLANLSSVSGLECEQLIKAKYWKASIRDENLECGQPTLDFEDFHEIPKMKDEAQRQQALDHFHRTLERFVRTYSRKPRETIQINGKKKEIFHMTGAAVLPGISLKRLKLDDIWLENANLDGANLTGVHLNRANLKGASLRGANLERANLNGVNLNRAELQTVLEPVVRPTNLRNSRLEGAQLIRANLERADLTGANLSKAKMRGAILKETVLKGATLIGVTGLTCEQLFDSTGWEQSFRSEQHHCGSDNPPRTRGIQ